MHEHTAMLHVYLSSGHVEEAEDLFVEMCEVLPASFAPLFLACSFPSTRLLLRLCSSFRLPLHGRDHFAALPTHARGRGRDTAYP